MIDEAKARAVIADVAEVCRKHGVVLVGVALDEGQFGEISIEDAATAKYKGVLNEIHVTPVVTAIG